MKRKRCPHCGRMIDKKADRINSKGAFKSSVLHSQKVARCSHCNNTYGVGASSPYIITRIWLSVVLFIIGKILNMSYLRVISVFSVFYTIFTPYARLDSNGKLQDVDPALICDFEITEEYVRLRKKQMYFLTNDFDGYTSFQVVSPIKVVRVRKRSNMVSAIFLYNHDQNYEYTDKDAVKLYDSDMNLVAKIKFNGRSA